MEKTSLKELKKNFFSLILYWQLGCFIGTGANLSVNSYRYLNQKIELENQLKCQNEHVGELPLFFPFSDHKDLLLSSHAKEAIHKICNHSLSSSDCDFDSRYLAPLDINLINLENAYGDFRDFSSSWHYNSTYYDRDKKTIDWDKLAVRIYENGQETARKDEPIEPFSLSEVQEKLEHMKCYLSKVQHDFSEFDVAELACKLEDYQFFNRVDTLMRNKNYEIIAATYYDRIIYSHLEEDYSSDFIRATDYHEDFHLFANSCIDKMFHLNESRNCDGIGIANSIDLDSDVIDDYNLSRYQYTFLEEIYAELYSARCLEKNQESYLSNDEVLNAIQLVLAMDEDYSVDEILEDLLYQHPISFIRHFPVYGNDKDAYLMKTCQMLKSFDTLLETDRTYFEQLEEQGLQVKEGVSQLKMEAFSHLSSLFFNRLIVMNDDDSSDMTLDDNFSMIELFDTYLKKANTAINYHMRLMEQEVDWKVGFYDSSFMHDRSVFFSYLSKEYKMDEAEIFQQYVEHDTREDYNFPIFNEEKREYYQQLLAAKSQSVLDPTSIPLQIHNKTYNLQLK